MERGKEMKSERIRIEQLSPYVSECFEIENQTLTVESYNCNLEKWCTVQSDDEIFRTPLGGTLEISAI